MAKELAESVLGYKDKPAKAPKKVVREVRHRKAGKGFIVEHHHESPMHPMEEHVMADKPALMAHIDGLHQDDEAAEGPQPGGPQE